MKIVLSIEEIKKAEDLGIIICDCGHKKNTHFEFGAHYYDCKEPLCRCNMYDRKSIVGELNES